MPPPNQLEVVISARNQASPELQRLQSQIRSMEPVFRAPSEALERSTLQARGALQLLSRDLGITMPRAVQSFLATSNIIGPALSAAFSTVAIAGFLMVLKEVPEAITRVTNALAGWDAETQKAYQHNIELNKTLFDSAQALQKINQQRQLEGLEGPGAAAKSLEFARQHTQELQNQLRATMAQRDAAQQLINAWNAQRAPVGTPMGPAAAPEFLAGAERYLFAPAATQQAFDSIGGLNDKVLQLNAQLKVSQAEGGLAGDKLKTAFSKAADAAQETSARFDALHNRITGVIDAANRLAAKQSESPLNQQALQIEQQLAAIERERAAYLAQMGVSQSSYVEALDKASAQLTTALNELHDKMAASIHASMLDGLTAGLHDFLSGIEGEKLQQLQAGVPAFTGAHPGLPELDTEEMGAAAARLQATMAGLGNTAMVVNNAFSGLFWDLQSGTVTAANAFSNMANRMLADMASLIEQALVWKFVSTIFSGLGGGGGGGFLSLLGSIFGFLGGGGGAQSFSPAGFMDFLGGYAGPFSHDYPGQAIKGQPYLIGTPELFVPRESGFITPLKAGGGDVTINMTNASGTPLQAKAQKRLDVKGMVIDIMLEDMSTNGPYAQALRSGR